MQSSLPLHMTRDELGTMSEEEEPGGHGWRAKLLRCQRQLKAKEEELSRQSQYFQSFKIQVQRKLSAAQDREQSLLGRIYTLEKQLLDMTVSAATGMATMKAVRITAGTVTYLEEQERGEGEGEEEEKEDRKRLWRPPVGNEGVEGGKTIDTNQNTNGARLQSFIISLQEDLRELLEREETRMTEQRRLMEQLQEAQEKGTLLSFQGDEMKAELQQLKLSESCLMEEVEDLREENHKLLQVVRGSSSAVCSVASITGRTGMVLLSSDEGVVPVLHHQGAAESSQSADGPAKNTLLFGSSPNNNLTSLPFTTETVDEFDLRNLNMDEVPSEESDALLQAYKSLGFGDDVQALQEQHGPTFTKEHLQNNTSQLMHPREPETARPSGSSGETILPSGTYGGDHLLQESLANADASPTQDDLIHALNQENRALADRIQELMYHIGFREEQIPKEQIHVREQIVRLQENETRLQQANQEQASLISELTKKTEDDLNTIMELQQKLAETKDPQDGEERKDSCNVHNEEVHRHPTGTGRNGKVLTSDCASDRPHIDQCQFLEESSQNTLDSSSPLKQETLPTTSLLRLQTDQEELQSSIKSLSEQQKEVSLSVRAQTEEKHQLTREMWGLKEEKDSVSKSLADLKLEKEKLGRTICGLRDERQQFLKSMSSLKAEKEQLTQTLSTLERETDTVKKWLSTETERRDQIVKSMQSLQTESDKLNRSVIHLREERDELSEDLKCLKEQKGQEMISEPSKEERLISSVSRGREEERQTELGIHGRKEERACLQSEERRLTQYRLDPDPERETERSKSPAGPSTPRATGRPKEQEHHELRTANEALKEELKRLQLELDRSVLQGKQLHSELLQSETRREGAESRATHAEETVTRLTVDHYQMEDTKRENQSLVSQVTELQSRVSRLLREKSEALSLKAQMEEQYSVLSAQLKAKTAALQELNSEFIALKRERVSRDDQGEALVSLRSRYNDIRSKYDTLLKRKSQADFNAAPLKAKLSCLVVKCQERNNLLAQMMKAMLRQGSVDPQLTQQVEHVLSDAALQDYSAAFASGCDTKTRSNCTGYATQIIATLQDCTLASTSTHQRDKRKVLARPAEQSFSSDKFAPNVAATKSTRNEAPPAATPLKGNPTKPNSPVQESDRPSVVTDNEHLTTNATTLGSVEANEASPSGSESPKNGFHHIREKRLPRSADSPRSTRNPASPSPGTPISPRRRLSSPEKILSLHEELQQTLMGCSQLSETKRSPDPTRRTRSRASSVELNPKNKQNHSLLASNTHSTTLFSAVVSRSAALSPCRFPNHLKSSSSTDTQTTPTSNADIIPASPETSEAEHSETIGNTPTDSNDETSAATAVRTTDPLHDGDVCASRCFARSSKPTQCIHGSLKRPNKPTRRFSDVLGKRKSSLPNSEVPGEVSCVKVINTVGQSSILIGWERPPLDELGCSNGTFVYGYRVFVNENFHKSVLSSACTKCVLENVDLSLPVQISVQTLGLNGRTSNNVYTTHTHTHSHNNASR